MTGRLTNTSGGGGGAGPGCAWEGPQPVLAGPDNRNSNQQTNLLRLFIASTGGLTPRRSLGKPVARQGRTTNAGLTRWPAPTFRIGEDTVEDNIQNVLSLRFKGLALAGKIVGKHGPVDQVAHD